MLSVIEKGLREEVGLVLMVVVLFKGAETGLIFADEDLTFDVGGQRFVAEEGLESGGLRLSNKAREVKERKEKIRFQKACFGGTRKRSEKKRRRRRRVVQQIVLSFFFLSFFLFVRSIFFFLSFSLFFQAVLEKLNYSFFAS